MNGHSGHNAVAALLTAALAAALIGASDTGIHAAGNFNPLTSVSISNHVIGAPADVTFTIDLAAPSLFYDEWVTLSPTASTIADGPPGNPVGTPLLGDIVGSHDSATNFGEVNRQCDQTLGGIGYLLNATTDNTSGNLIFPSILLETSHLGPLAPLLDDSNSVSDGSPPFDQIGSAGPGSAISPLNGLPARVDLYPAYLNIVFDPDGLGGITPVQPMARYSEGAILASSAGLEGHMWEFLVFPPGALTLFLPPHPFADLSAASLGFSTFMVTDDPTSVSPAVPKEYSDFCSPVGDSVQFFAQSRVNPCNGNPVAPCDTTSYINNAPPGPVTGNVRYTNPISAGTHLLGAFYQSRRDLDGDGYENSLDTCPFSVNTDASPRVSSGPDTDNLDSSCDPGPASNNTNQDGDSAPNGQNWYNAQDNCPRISNPDNAQVELSQLENVRRPRGGSSADDMGDACDGAETSCADALDNDASPSGPEGLINDGCPVVGASGAETVCTGNVDNDGDGFVNDGCPAVGAAETAGAQCSNYVSDDDDNGDTTINASDTINDGCAAVGTAAEPGCLNSFDDDGDTVVNDGCASSSKVANGHYHTDWDLIPVCIGGTDADGDGWCAAPLAATDPIIDPDDGNSGRTPEAYARVRFFPVAHSGSGMSSMGPGIAHPREPLQACNDGIDNDGDGLMDLQEGDGPDTNTLTDCNPRSVALPSADTDGDGYPDANEIYIGTDPMGRCERTGTGVSQSNDWPADHVGGATSGDKITLTDISTYTATPKRFNTKPGDANFLPRYDVNPGTTTPGATQNWIVLTDLSNISSLIPPMFNGARAFGGPTCAAHLTLND